MRMPLSVYVCILRAWQDTTSRREKYIITMTPWWVEYDVTSVAWPCLLWNNASTWSVGKHFNIVMPGDWMVVHVVACMCLDQSYFLVRIINRMIGWPHNHSILGPTSSRIYCFGSIQILFNQTNDENLYYFRVAHFWHHPSCAWRYRLQYVYMYRQVIVHINLILKLSLDICKFV